MLAASCSTTKRIEKGEMLYTGVKTVDIQTPEGEMLPADLTSQIKEAVNVAPNNCLISPSLRYPFPLGLWVYNNWPNPPSGFRHWLYEKLAAEPVLISDVRPEVRTHMIEQLLADNGYFRGRASYELVSKKNKRKASIIYRVTPGSPYVIDSIAYIPDTCRLNHYIDSLALADPYLKVGAPYCVDSLAEVRTRIAITRLTSHSRFRKRAMCSGASMNFAASTVRKSCSALRSRSLSKGRHRLSTDTGSEANIGCGAA